MKNLELIQPEDKYSMRGAGVVHKQNRLITHTTLHHSQSALATFVPWQIALIVFLASQALFGLVLFPLTTITVIIGLLSAVYFIDVIFNLYVILKSLYFPPEITFETSEVAELESKTLPMYSILCPLYHESKVLPDFLDSIEKLDWPKDKLEVLLLLEEDDQETIETADSLILPAYIKKIIVPQSQPKTKPKACNFGLSLAQGEYLVIFDAEDRPEPDQLKKAYLGFQKVPQSVVCLQAKLNYFNPHQNLLTRLFTAEYSLWFDVVLTGLQSINTAIPLGGTSNHFKTQVLKNLEGWDPFNVTEDCDLGIRLFKKGYKTAIIDSTTWEEANSNVKNWLRQRSRWIKGYLQTYLVHNRSPLKFVRRHGIHAFIFQLIIGARMSFMFINPILWLMTISYFALYAIVGPTIESFYPAPVFYMAVISLIFGNFMYIYNYMIGAAKRGQWNLIKFVYLIPFYWLMASVAATIALYQLLTKPHYWEKTIHGFHLKKEEENTVASSIIEGEEATLGFAFPAYLRNKILSGLNQNKNYLGGVLLIIGSMFGNFLNFVFNTYLGRTLDLKDFAAVSLIGSFMYFASIPFNAISATVNHRSGYLIGKYNLDYAQAFINKLTKNILTITILASALWLILTPINITFFNNSNLWLYLSFSLVLIFGFLNAVNFGYFGGKLLFGLLGLIAIVEPAVKLIIVYGLNSVSLGQLSYLSIPLAFVFTFLIGYLLIKREKIIAYSDKFEIAKYFPKSFLGASVLTNLSAISFLSLDIVMANHYLSPSEAGKYSLLSLVGKIIFFFGGLSFKFIIPIVSRNEGANKSSTSAFNKIFLSTGVLSFIGFLILGVFGNYTVPLLFGTKSLLITDYLIFFSFAMMLFTISRVFVTFHLAKKIYSFAVVSFLLSVIQLILMKILHQTIRDLVIVMIIVAGLNFTLLLAMHLLSSYVKIIESNILDFLYLFRTKASPNPKRDKLAILIFNWRDIRHKWAGGAEVYVHELSKRWVKKGHKVTIFCGNDGHSPRYEEIDGVEIIRRGGFYFDYIWAFLYYMVKFRGKYDVIIDSENGIPFFTPLYAREKIFLLIHHVHQEVFRKSLALPFAYLASFLELKLMPIIYKNTQVITVSPSSRDEILRHKLTKKEPIIIYNGVDPEIFSPGEKNKTPLILYLGRLQHYKSLNVFVKAARRVLKRVPGAEFVIAGEGEEKKKLVKYARKLGISKKIKFLGFVSNQKKIELLKKAWVFVNPSFMEGWGITTLEANACGTPAIASNVPGLRDSISNPHTGILVKYGDHKAFAENIVKLIKDKELRKEMSEESLKWAGNFSWDKSAADFYSIILEKVRRHGEHITEKALINISN